MSVESAEIDALASLATLQPRPGHGIGLRDVVQLESVVTSPPNPWDDHVVICAPGVDLLGHASSVLEQLLIHDPDVDLAYLDGCHRADSDETYQLEAQHRPGFSPERLEAQMYLGDVVLVRRSVLIDLVRTRLEEAADPDDEVLMLPLGLQDAIDLAERSSVIAHVPRILYRSEPPRVKPVIDLRPQLTKRPLTSIVIPTNGATRTIHGREQCLVVNAVNSVVARTGYEHYEVVVVLTPGFPDDLPDRIRSTVAVHGPARQPAVRFYRDDRPFNFSNASNLGAMTAEGDVLVFLNDDTEVQSSDWLDHVVSYAVRPEIGAVGARLLYEDGSIQHAGIWSRGGYPSHRYVGFPADHSGHLDALLVPQNCLAVSGACLGVERAKFVDVGGFCVDFPSSYNDVDLCLKLGELGYRTVVVSDAVLTHFEASTREPSISDREIKLLNRRWRRLLIADPFDNPNHLAPESDEFPPPLAGVTLAREQAGLVTHHRRLWRSNRSVRPVEETVEELIGEAPSGR